MCICVGKELASNYLFQYFKQKGQIGNGATVLNAFGSRDGFFNTGLTTAVLKSDDTVPVVRKWFMIFVIVGKRTSRFSHRSCVGIGFSSHVFGTDI